MSPPPACCYNIHIFASGKEHSFNYGRLVSSVAFRTIATLATVSWLGAVRWLCLSFISRVDNSLLKPGFRVWNLQFSFFIWHAAVILLSTLFSVPVNLKMLVSLLEMLKPRQFAFQNLLVIGIWVLQYFLRKSDPK